MSLWSALAVLFLAPSIAFAFPPAPPHTFYGVVRNEMGEPLVVTNAEVILETLTGTRVGTAVAPHLGPGVNYRLKVPMDAGLTADNYRPNALRPTVAFRMRVQIGRVTYLPLEMRANFANLGKPAQSTHLDLTLGEDTDGDGLPDAWERALIAMLGGTLTLPDIRPEDDADGDGLSNAQEYVAGTYAFDPQDGFRLEMLGLNEGRPVLEFLAIPGRAYTLLASEDLNAWLPAWFRFATDAANAPPRTLYTATDVRRVRIEAVLPGASVPDRMVFRAQVH